MQGDGREGPTTFDVPALKQLHEWQAEAQRKGELAPIPGPAASAPAPALSSPMPVAPPQAPPVDSYVAPAPATTDGAPLTDWMSPDELEAALAFGKPAVKAPSAVAPRTAHTTAPSAIPKWVVPLVAVGALGILLGAVALILVFAR